MVCLTVYKHKLHGLTIIFCSAHETTILSIRYATISTARGSKYQNNEQNYIVYSPETPVIWITNVAVSINSSEHITRQNVSQTRSQIFSKKTRFKLMLFSFMHFSKWLILSSLSDDF